MTSVVGTPRAQPEAVGGQVVTTPVVVIVVAVVTVVTAVTVLTAVTVEPGRMSTLM